MQNGVFFADFKAAEEDIPFGDLEEGDNLLLGQDEDDLPGVFDMHQAFSGKLANVNMWNRSLSQAEIEDWHHSSCLENKSMSAASAANVISWPANLDGFRIWNVSDVGITTEGNKACQPRYGHYQVLK